MKPHVYFEVMTAGTPAAYLNPRIGKLTQQINYQADQLKENQMKKYRNTILMSAQVCSLLLLMMSVAASASAETFAAAAHGKEAQAGESRENEIVPPPVPDKLHVRPGFVAFFEGHGVGTQNYICKPT